MQPSLLTFDFEWRPLHNYLRSQGLEAPQLSPAAGSDGQPPSHALYDWVVHNHKVVTDGLQLGRHYNVSDYGMAGLALLSAETLAEALKVVRAYMLLFNPDIADIRVEHGALGDTRVITHFRIRAGWNARQCQFHANVLASASHHLFNQLMGHPLHGLGLTLPAGLGDTRAYRSHFGMPVRSFGSDIIFHLPPGLLESPIPTANPAVFQAAIAQASSRFNTLLASEMGGTRQRVGALLASLPDRYLEIGQIAQHLKLTERTLRRRLADEGCSYRQILDQARLQRACELLERTPLNAEQIAELLGYADTSSLRQAFRRWTGMSLGEYRQHSTLQAESAPASAPPASQG